MAAKSRGLKVTITQMPERFLNVKRFSRLSAWSTPMVHTVDSTAEYAELLEWFIAMSECSDECSDEWPTPMVHLNIYSDEPNE